MTNLEAIYFLKGGPNSRHKIDALRPLVKIPVILEVVKAKEPDHHILPRKLIQAKHTTFVEAWHRPVGRPHLTAVADVTTNLGGQPIRKPISTNLSDLAAEIAEFTRKVGLKSKFIPLDEYAALLFAVDSNSAHTTPLARTFIPQRALKDRKIIEDYIEFSGYGAQLLNMSLGLEAASFLAFLSDAKQLGGRQPKDLVNYHRSYKKMTPNQIFRRLSHLEEIERIKLQVLKNIDPLTLLVLTETAVNIPFHAVKMLLAHLNHPDLLSS